MEGAVKLSRKYWYLYFTAFTAFATLFIWLAQIGVDSFVGDVYWLRYDGRPIFYWSIYYPDLFWIPALVGFLILFLIWIKNRLRKPVKSDYKIFRYSLALLFAVTSFFCFIPISQFFITDAPLYRHLMTVQVADKTYHLGAIYLVGGRDRYVLYRCDSWGLLCEVAYDVLRWRYGKDSFFDDIQLETNSLVFPKSPRLNVRIDGAITYSDSP